MLHVGLTRGKRKGKDNYPTPSWVTKALLDEVQFKGNILEPACGSGNMVRGLKKWTDSQIFYQDIRTDNIHNDHGGIDFLAWKPDKVIRNVVSNPPFNIALEFIKKSLQIATQKVCLLLRLNFLESGSRYKFFKNSPLKWVYVFCDRVAFYPEGKRRNSGGTIAFAWYVWSKGYKGEPTIRWIAPGKKRSVKQNSLL